MEDWYQLEDSQEMMDNLIGVVANNDQQKISILSEIGYTKDNFTQDPEEAKNDPSKILMIPDPDGSGGLIPQFNESQEEEIGKFVRNMFAAQISQKTGLQKGHQVTYKPEPRAKTATEIGLEDRDKSRANLYSTVNDLVTGDPNKAESAANTLVTIFNKNKGEDVPELLNVDRVTQNGKTVFKVTTEDGVQTVNTEHNDGTTKSTADIIKEIYDNVSPYEDDVTVAIDAFKGEIGENVGEGDVRGKGKFKKIPEIDYDSPVVIDGNSTGALSYITGILGKHFDPYTMSPSDARYEEIYTNVADALMPKVMRDAGVDFKINVSDGTDNDGTMKITYTIPQTGESYTYTIYNTAKKKNQEVYSSLKKAMNQLRQRYNDAGEGGGELD